MKMEYNGFKRVCSVNELKEEQGKRFIIDDVDTALFKLDGEVYAVSNICPHQHTAKIYDGYIDDGRIVCPMHAWSFDLKTGKMGGGSRGLDVYDVKIENDDVFVKVKQKELKW